MKGEGCKILKGARVEHVDCDDYPKGAITDIVTGEVIDDE
jgi:hypothetical protein